MLMHGLWDASAALASSGLLGSLVPVIVAGGLISVFVWVYRTTVPIEREWMRELMAPEVALGVVTQAELEALAGPRSTLRDYVRSQPSRRAAELVLDAETDLAHQLARDGGGDTAGVQRARAAVAQARSG